jgi:hypothetical protein
MQLVVWLIFGFFSINMKVSMEVYIFEKFKPSSLPESLLRCNWYSENIILLRNKFENVRYSKTLHFVGLNLPLLITTCGFGCATSKRCIKRNMEYQRDSVMWETRSANRVSDFYFVYLHFFFFSNCLCWLHVCILWWHIFAWNCLVAHIWVKLFFNSHNGTRNSKKKEHALNRWLNCC